MCSMGTVEQKVWHCDECGFEWIRTEGVVPLQCPSRKCRSRKWNTGGDSETRNELQGERVGAVGSGSRGRARQVLSGQGTERCVSDECADAGKRRGNDSVPAQRAAEVQATLSRRGISVRRASEIDEAPESTVCGFQAFNDQDGDTYRCGLAKHGPRVKHGNWAKV